MFIVRLVTLVSFLTHSFGLNEISNNRVFLRPAKKIPSVENLVESWDEGEVAWDVEQVKDNQQVVLLDKPMKLKRKRLNDNNSDMSSTNREKIWGLVEKLRMHGAISGVLNVAYYNTAVSDNIINDFQNFKVNQPASFVNIITYNYNNILDILVTLFAVVGYNKYKKTRISTFILTWGEVYKNNYYIKEFRAFRKVSITLSLMTLVIFSKSVQNAI
jgi:hypothetical protein